MKRYVVERRIDGAGAADEGDVRAVARRIERAADAMGPALRWIESYWTEDRLFCVVEAEDEVAVRRHAVRTGLPADRVMEVHRVMDPSDARRDEMEWRVPKSRRAGEQTTLMAV